jgi:hypothetical protein
VSLTPPADNRVDLSLLPLRHVVAFKIVLTADGRPQFTIGLRLVFVIHADLSRRSSVATRG